MKTEVDQRLQTLPNPKNKVIPNQHQLAELKRDLSFWPAGENHQLICLEKKQVDDFNRRGYLTGINIFDQEEINLYRTDFDRLLSSVMDAGGGSYSILSAHLKYKTAYDLLTHPRIVAYVKDLLGKDVVAWGAHYFCKMPQDGKIVAWHQDASYWPLTPSKTITVWLAIDDTDVNNGCMRFLSGSHLHGHLPYRISNPNEHNILNQTVERAEDYGTPVNVELNAGQISIHSDLLLHSSNFNRSNRRRCGLTLRYCTPDVRGHFEWNQEGVIVSGSDLSNHWSNHARPMEE